MLTAILICSIYVALLFGLTKFFGVKYTDLIKNTENIKKGIVYPIGIATTLLVIFSYVFSWLPEVMSFEPAVKKPILWIIPLVTTVAIIARFYKAHLSAFNKKGILFLVIGTFIVGVSEELLVRGIAVSSLEEAGYSVLLTGVISSLIFGLLHFMNYFNGQDIKKTSVQVFGTVLMGLNFYVILVISGTLWVPIIFHFLYDLSILLLGPDPKLDNSLVSKVISIATLAMFVLPVIGLVFLR